MSKPKAASSDKFVEWIRKRTTIQVAQKFGRHQATVEAWVNRRALPTIVHMVELVRMADGEFDYKDVIEPFFAANPHLVDRYKL